MLAQGQHNNIQCEAGLFVLTKVVTHLLAESTREPKNDVFLDQHYIQRYILRQFQY